MPQVVADAELPSAATLSGLQFNISGIIGPALGGLLVPLAGADFVFALNGACFLLIVLATRQCKQPAVPAKLPSERFFESFGTIFHYVRYAPGFQAASARNFLFALFISVIPALMPVVGLVAAQRAMPSWARGRMNATVIMISQGAMALGGVIWGSAAATAGASYTLLGAAVLFLTSLLLARRLSISVAGNLEQRVSGVLSIRVEPRR